MRRCDSEEDVRIQFNLVKSEAQLLVFTLGGVLLLVTGLIMKLQYK